MLHSVQNLLPRVITISILLCDPESLNPSTPSKPFLGTQAGPATYQPEPSTGRVASAQ